MPIYPQYPQYGYGYTPTYQPAGNQPGTVPTYQTQVQQMAPTAQMPATSTQQSQGLIWVQGEAGAKAYLVAPGGTVLLMDSEAERFYLKSCDAAGMPNLRTYEYKEIALENVQKPSETAAMRKEDYCTREEFEALKKRYNDFEARLTGGKQTTRKKVVEVTEEDDE